MTPWNPWVSDLRQQHLRSEMSRIGFPIPPNCRLRRYRSFTIRAAVFTFAFLCLFAFTRDFVNTPTSHIGLNVKKMSSAKDLRYDGEPSRKGVIILTNHRSGSTFLGQLFNQRPDVFFMFEPLLPFGHGCSANDDHLRVEYLAQLFACDIQDLLSLPTYKGSKKISDFRSIKKCGEENFCFREKSKRMCSREFCKHDNHCWDCEPVNSKVASKMCRNSSLTAMKVIRFCDLVHFRPLFENPSLDIKMLHLVRDPRGVSGSRQKLESAWGLEKMNDTCKKIEKAIDVGFDPKNSWLEGKYKVVRYEDFCQNPLQTADEIYKFVGLRMTPQLKKWIISNTKGRLAFLGDSRAQKVAHNVRKEDKRADLESLRDAILNDPYTTTRNSSATWKAWRSDLDFRTVEQVQSACKTVMDKLRYIPVASELQLKNDDFNVLTKFCSDKTLPPCRSAFSLLP